LPIDIFKVRDQNAHDTERRREYQRYQAERKETIFDVNENIVDVPGEPVVREAEVQASTVKKYYVIDGMVTIE
jgi:hypothetical protein